MGIKLMVEVLDFYHGPNIRKLWLVAFAESASDRTREGWPGRVVLAHRTDVSPSRASHIATELVAEGVIERTGGGGRHRASAKYVLLPLTADTDFQSAPRAHPDEDSQGAPRAHPKPGFRVRNQGSQGAESGSQGASISPSPAQTSYNPQNPHEPSPPAREASIIRSAFPDVTEGEAESIIRDIRDEGVRSVAAVIRHRIGEGSLRLPCDAGTAPHSDECRRGDSSGCWPDWCKCRCHVKPGGIR